MKLSTVLQKHSDTKTQTGLTNSLGDSYLTQHNRVFSHIRNKALELHFKFSNHPSMDYMAFPMGQLENILKEKTLPYLNNVSPLQKLIQNSKFPIEWDHVVDNLKPNYVFHESCHAVARAYRTKPANPQQEILAMLIEESFANTCEFLAIADAQESVHRLFLDMNSYFTIFEDRIHLKMAIEKYGLTTMAKFMLLCYVHSHFLNDRIKDSEFKKIISMGNFNSEPDLKILKSIATNAFALNPRFRYTTTEMYLRLNGIKTPVEQALNFDPFALIQKEQNIKTFIEHLVFDFT